MSSQNNLEQTIKRIHILMAESPKVKGSPDKIVVDKSEMFACLEEVSRCMCDMLDEYKLTNEQKKEEYKKIKEEHDKMIDSASKKVEDVYSAVTVFTDNAISRLVRIVEDAQNSLDGIYADYNRKIDEEKNRLRANQKVLENQLFEMRDSELYFSLLEEQRRRMAQNFEPIRAVRGNYPEPEIKINQAYFEQMGLNLDGTKKEESINEEVAAPEIIVNTNADYFKWKNGEEISNPFIKGKVDHDETKK